MSPLELNIQGNYTIHRRPERGVLIFNVSSTGPSQTTTTDTVKTTSTELRTLIHSLCPKQPGTHVATPDAAITTFSISSFHTRSWLPEPSNNHEMQTQTQMRSSTKAPEPVRQYSCTVRFEAIFRDMQVLADVAGRISTIPCVEMAPVQWKLTDETTKQLQREIRKEALKDAIEKGNDMAEVLGREVVVVEVQDSGITTGGRTMQTARRAGYMQMQSATLRGSGAEDDGLIFEPVDVVLTSHLEVKLAGK